MKPRRVGVTLAQSAMLVHLQLLGGFQLTIGPGEAVAMPTRKAQALIAYLAMRPGQRHSRDKLAALLWGDRGEPQARHSLRQTLLAIRKALPGNRELVYADATSIGIDRSVEVDVARFEELAGGGGVAALRKAAALYHGPLLEGITINEEGFEDWLLIERERLRAACMEVLSTLLSHHANEGETELAIQSGVKLLALDPLQEAVHRKLMSLHMKLGRREAAIRQYQMCATLLERDLGIEPEMETRQIYSDIVQSSVPAVRPPETKGRSSGKSILVVDDDIVTRALVEAFLQEDGYEVHQADDGADALLQLGARDFDLILVDLNMPTIDGLQLLEILGSKAISTPAICLTALTGEEFEIAGLRLGAVDFIRKPVRKEVLQVRVRNAFRSSDTVSTVSSE